MARGRGRAVAPHRADRAGALMVAAAMSPAVDRYVPALTGLRAVAAYLVFLHHYNPAPPGTFGHRLLAQGYVGVTIFFVLSGFLIYHRYAGARPGANWSWRTYGQSRFARIFPLYAVVLLLTVVGAAKAGHPMPWPEVGLNLTLLKGFFDEYKFSGIPQSWSLTVEACFYLTAPLLFAPPGRWGPIRLTIGLTGLGVGLLFTVGQVGWHGLFGSPSLVLFYTFFGRSFEFAAGMWLARRWHQNRLPRLPFATGAGLLLMAVCVAGQAGVSALTVNRTALIVSEVLLYNYVLPVGIGLFFTGLLRHQTVVQRLLSTGFMQALGYSSYAFYLIHVGVVSKLLQRMMPTVAANRLLLFLLLLLVARALYVLIERPCHRWLRPARLPQGQG